MARGSDTGPLFMRQDGKYMTRDFFVAAIREALTEAGLRAVITRGTASALVQRQPLLSKDCKTH